MTEAEFERLRRLQNELIDTIRAAHPGFGARDRLERDELHRRPAAARECRNQPQ